MTHHAIIKPACEELAACEPALARAYEAIGVPEWRAAPHGFETLARTVTFQLISTKAAATIWGRVLDLMESDVSPARLLSQSHEDLRACGLSGPKIRHMQSIAEAIESGALPMHALPDMSDAEARKALVAVKGIGPWTADVYLLFSLGRMDAFPQADIGLIEAYRLLREDETRRSPKDFLIRADSWRPWRGVAAHLLWGYLNDLREKNSFPSSS